uniref:SJCHGC00537 protein n=1 Tax=Schistosoma japonicum TaxID=6182 RepID=Q5DGC9_SCHJA|nr:SJCHGC00537 protein [Schistosoma japonicum]
MSDLAVCRFASDGVVTAVVKILESDGEKLHVDQAGRNPLHWAAYGGHLELVKVLLAKGFDKDSKDHSNWTPLMIAVSAGRDNVASYLISQEHADVNVVNSTGQCCLHYCASKNRLQLAKQLLGAGAKPDVHDWGGITPLHRAIATENLDIAKLLLDHTATGDVDNERVVMFSTLVNSTDKKRQTPLHYACEEGNFQAVTLLMNYGASTDHEDLDGKTPVDVAPDHLRMNMLKLLKAK